MRGKVTSEDQIALIKDLRSQGSTLLEIKKLVPVGKTTIFKYINKVPIQGKYLQLFKSKRSGSKNRSKADWKKAENESNEILSKIKYSFDPLVLACIYWGEGNKRELSLINSDPNLVKVFVDCLYSIGVKKENLLITLRVYEDKNIQEIKVFWANLLEIPLTQIQNVNILNGKKEGKLKFGMCRVRVRKGGRHFKLIMSMIAFIKSYYKAAVVQWIEQDTPNV